MPSFTRNEIKKSFLKLLETRRLSDITVKDIVEDCQINRSSFYYHYHDIQMLLEEIIQEATDEIIQKYPTVESTAQCLDAVIEFMLSRKRPMLRAYQSISRDLFERHMARTCEYFVTSYVNVTLAERPMTEKEKRLTIQYYKYLLMGFTVDWLESGLKEQKAEEFREILLSKSELPRENAR